MPDQTTGAAPGAETPHQDQPNAPQNWAGAMAQIDAEIAELQQLLASRRAASTATDDEDERPDAIA